MTLDLRQPKVKFSGMQNYFKCPKLAVELQIFIKAIDAEMTEKACLS